MHKHRWYSIKGIVGAKHKFTKHFSQLMRLEENI